MASSKVFLVPVDFSRSSERAFDYARRLARENQAQIVALNVVPAELVYPPTGGQFDIYGLMERDARDRFAKMAKRKAVKATECKLVLAHGTDFADVIVRQGKKLRAAMIIMGCHGRTGLRRFLLGSVAERTLRYADCPVLIVK